MAKSKVWVLAPPMKEEGVFMGHIIRIESMDNPDYVRILFRKSGTPLPPHIDTTLPPELFEYLYRDELDAAGCVKVIMHIPDTYVPEDDDKATDVDALISNIKTDDLVTIRTSRNWKGNHLFVRYIENTRTGEYAGWPEEADWRQAAHPYAPWKESGTAEFLISHIDRITDEDGRTVYTLELSNGDPVTPRMYRAYALPSSAAGTKIRESGIKNLNGIKAKLTLAFQPDTNRTMIDDMEVSEKEEKQEKRKRKRASPPVVPYQEQKKIAERYEKIPKSEYEKTDGIYNGKMIEIDGLDYGQKYQFAAFRLSDGRIVVPEIRNDNARNWDKKIQDTDNLIFSKSLLHAGLLVTLYFSPGRQRPYMLLRGISYRKGL